MNKVVLGFQVLALSCVAVVFLSGCGLMPNDVTMPRGYAKHQNTYRSNDAPPPPLMDYAYSELQSAESVAYWRMACEDLVGRVVAKHGVSDLPVFLSNEDPFSDLNTVFDHFLREALIDAGFTIAGAMGEIPIIRFDAEKISNAGHLVPADQAPMTDGLNTLLTLNIEGGGRLLAVEKGVYNIVESR